MFKQGFHSLKMVFGTALVLTTMAVTPISAQTTAQPGTNRDNASTPLANAVTIEAKSTHWYKFKYSYDSSSGKEPSEAVVLLKMDSAECVGFDVETPGTLAASPQDSKQHEPIGRGSPVTKKEADFDSANADETAKDAEDTNENGQIDKDENPYYDKEHGVVKNEQTLIWVGSARAKETFYVVVKNKSDAACAYGLTISGPTVSFPAK